ncbi:Ig-like domain-containing protein [Nonomuraea sp. MTCD27]
MIRRLLRYFVILTAVMLLTTAVVLALDRPGKPPAVPVAGPPPAAAPPVIEITPADGGRNVRPERGVAVRVSGGTLTEVTVKGVKGHFNAARTEWTSDRALAPARSFTVAAAATGAGGTAATATSRFRTLKPARTIEVEDVTPERGEKVGVGMPIIVTFNRDVADKAAVERALVVESGKRSEGAWRWLDDRTAVYRTRTYWKAHQKVTFEARLTGVRAGRNVYGVKGHRTTFEIGAARISTVDVDEHTMVVRRDGEKVRTIPISAGNGATREYTTTSGVHLTMAKTDPEVMTSPGRAPGQAGYYETVVNDAVRISDSGEFVHSAPWSVGSQGRANVSHGCVNVSPRHAAWFYERTRRGDVVQITGTDRRLEWDNGWGFWQMSWKQWRRGSRA